MYENTYAFSLLDSTGKTLACAGLDELWPNRATAWAFLSADLKPRGMMMITRAMLREFAATKYERIEAYVDANFEEGNKWARLLGFVNETPNGMQKFNLGVTHNLYARVR